MIPCQGASRRSGSPDSSPGVALPLTYGAVTQLSTLGAALGLGERQPRGATERVGFVDATVERADLLAHDPPAAVEATVWDAAKRAQDELRASSRHSTTAMPSPRTARSASGILLRQVADGIEPRLPVGVAAG